MLFPPLITLPHLQELLLLSHFIQLEYKFEGDTASWKNISNSKMNIVEFVTAPNNPDGQMNKAVIHGPNAKAIHDHAYYWPYFAPISASPANEDLMIFSLSKLTGHAGSRFGWAVIKDKEVYQRMVNYMSVSSMGVSRDTQLRALKLLKVVTGRGGREIFEFGYTMMRNRWDRLSKIISLSLRFSLQEITPQYCSFFQQVRTPSPAYAWLKCNWEEDKDCYAVLKSAKIIGREGSKFNADARYVRLSLIKSQDDIDLLLERLDALVAAEGGWSQNYA